MKYKDLEKLYLCGIGSHEEIESFRVGIYDSNRDSFFFSNGSYSAMELFKTVRGNSSTYVVSALPLQDIDNKFDIFEPTEYLKKEDL